MQQMTKTRPRPARPVEDDLTASLRAPQDPRWAVPAGPADAFTDPLGQLLTCPAPDCDATDHCVHSGPATPGRPDTGRADLADPVALPRPAVATPAAEWRPAVTAAPSAYYASTAPPATTPAEEDRPAEWRPMTTGQRIAGIVLAPLAVGLGVGGFTISFATIQARMTPHFGHLAWLVPSSIDLGILVFAGVHIWLAAVGMRMGWLRVVPWGLTAITIALNATAYAASDAILAHTTLPALWVIVCEVAAHVIGVRAGMKRGDRPDPIPLARWFLAPIATLRLWRNMRLWGIRSYKLAVAKERERLLVQTRLTEAFPVSHWGQPWNAKVPPMLLIRHKLRELTLADVEAELADRAAEDITATAAATAQPEATPEAATPATTPAATAPTTAEATATPQPLPAAADKATAKPRPQRPRGRDYRADMAKAFKEFVATHNGQWPNGTQLKDAANVSRTAAKNWLAAKRKELAA